MSTDTIEPYKAHLTPHLHMTRDLKFGGAWFEVCIDCQEPDEPGETTHPDNYWVEGVKLGGVWWGAEDVLSKYMIQCLNESLSALIADEHKEALKP